MAARMEARLPQKLSSTVKKRDEITRTTLDHIRRILSDHDYLKHPSPDELNNEKTAIVGDKIEPHVDQKNNIKSGFQDLSGACSSYNNKVEGTKQLPNEGIQASDLCSLLDKFEQAIGSSPSILTPATSPGRSEILTESLSLKINTQFNATDLTPPTTPPIQEQPKPKTVQNVCKPSGQQKKKTSKLSAKTRTINGDTGKAENLKCTTENNKVLETKTKTLPVISKKIVPKTAKVGSSISAERAKEMSNNQRENKRKCNDTKGDDNNAVSSAKKTKTCVENENAKDIKLSSSCQESKIILPETNTIVNESSEKITKDEKTVEMQNSESCSNVGDADKDKMKVEHSSNGVKESLCTENCSSVGEVFEGELPKLNTDKEEKHDKVNNNNNNIEAKVDACRNVSSKDELKVEKTQSKVHINDNHNDDHHKTNRRDNGESTKRKSERYNDAYVDDRRKRKHTSRMVSSDEDNSEEERSNPRRSERYSKSSKYSHDSERREKYRKYSSRDDYDREYSDEERRKHKKYDEHRNYNRKPWKNVRDIEHERKIDFRLGRSNIKDVAKGERRVIYVGGLPYGTTRDELWNRFRKFGPIEKVTVHLRVGERDNYGFLTFFEPEDARECIERGNSDPTEPRLDLCFGGRRQFCGGSYVDFDSTNSHIEELNETYGKVCDEIPEEDDFDSLLRMCQEGLGR